MPQIRAVTKAEKMLSTKGMFHQIVSWLISAFTVALLSIMSEGYNLWELVGSQQSPHIRIMSPIPIFHSRPSFIRGLEFQILRHANDGLLPS